MGHYIQEKVIIKEKEVLPPRLFVFFRLKSTRKEAAGRWEALGEGIRSLREEDLSREVREELPGGRNRSRGGDGGNSTWVNPKERAKPWGERSEGLPLHSNTQTP